MLIYFVIKNIHHGRPQSREESFPKSGRRPTPGRARGGGAAPLCTPLGVDLALALQLMIISYRCTLRSGGFSLMWSAAASPKMRFSPVERRRPFWGYVCTAIFVRIPLLVRELELLILNCTLFKKS